jgi:hypothetical protein
MNMEVCLSLWKIMERLLVTAFGCVNKNERCNFAMHEGARGKTMSNQREMTRREFVKDVAMAGAGLTIVPRHVLGKGMTPPSDLLNIAGVGVGGMGRANLINLASQNIVALCDVDWGYAGKAFERLAAEAHRAAGAAACDGTESHRRNRIRSRESEGAACGDDSFEE